jgi:hypothetical protein
MGCTYLWRGDVQPAGAEVWVNPARHLLPAHAPLAHDGVGVVVAPGPHVAHHAGALCSPHSRYLVAGWSISTLDPHTNKTNPTTIKPRS